MPPRLVGREREYDALLGYRSTVLATDGDWVPSFVLVGPGGVGKSALVSKFVSDQRREAGAAPLIYLDFDRATLIGATPLDLTFEFTRQLGLADFALEQTLDEFRERTRSLLGGQENLDIDIGGGASSAAQRDLASLLSAWPTSRVPGDDRPRHVRGGRDPRRDRRARCAPVGRRPAEHGPASAAPPHRVRARRHPGRPAPRG